MSETRLTIKEAARMLVAREISARELVGSYLEKIQKLNPRLFAYLSVNPEEATEQAEEADARISRGETTSLTGVPVAIKDNMVISGQKTTAGSKILENYRPPYTATAVKKLRDGGAVILGKTNLDEFAMGSSTENSGYGPSRNPWNEKKVPGGSSGGSAVAVAADLAVYALGSDTGGSIRQPAGFCGVVGMKPTYGRVSRHGLIAMASSLDQIGPMTKTVEDAALVLNQLVGFDRMDATTREKPEENFAEGLKDGIKGMKIGIVKEFLSEGLETGVKGSFEKAVQTLKSLGAKVQEVSLPNVNYSLATYYVIVPVEVASNLERYDGIKYGLSVQDGTDKLANVYFKTKAEGFGPEVKRRIILGTYASSAGYYDAYYKQALKVQQVIRQDFKSVFKDVDLLIGPTTPTTAFDLGEKASDPLAMYLADIFTVPVNIAGLPGISVPSGAVSGMPIGLQMIAPWWHEGAMLRAAYAFEQGTDFHKLTPRL